MGHGSWKSEDFDKYSRKVRGVDARELEHKTFSAQEFYRARSLNSSLSPKGVSRLCRDSEEHPNTLPVILALDVTGSMGSAAVRAATSLNSIITGIYNSNTIKDVEFCVMALGDIHYDKAPIQISQFESDIRIAEQMDCIWFEGGGGANNYESYSAAWYMGLNHCNLDCWNRGKKAIIITLGDEMPNPYLNAAELSCVTGDTIQADIETENLLKEIKEKFEVYHLSVKDPASSYDRNQRSYDLDRAWSDLLGEDHYSVVTIEELSQTLTEIVKNHADSNNSNWEQSRIKHKHFW